MTTATAYIRGENGTVFEMSWPLEHPDHAKRLAAGTLVRVNADGSPYDGSPDPWTVPGQDPDVDDEPDPEIAAMLREPVGRGRKS